MLLANSTSVLLEVENKNTMVLEGRRSDFLLESLSPVWADAFLWIFCCTDFSGVPSDQEIELALRQPGFQVEFWSKKERSTCFPTLRVVDKVQLGFHILC